LVQHQDSYRHLDLLAEIGRKWGWLMFDTLPILVTFSGLTSAKCSPTP
jgi:hypothetical protein